MSMLISAHIGHWTTSLAFFGPVLLLPAALYAFVLLDHRAQRGRDGRVDDEA